MARRRTRGSRYLVWLTDGEVDRAAVGGKGCSLSRLAALGVPVPIACALTTDAWRLFMRSLQVPIGVGNVDNSDLSRIRGLINTSPLPSSLSRSIATAYQEFESLPGGHISLAVRSSAMAEDSGMYSFAGVHDTLLGVRSHTGLEAAVRQCWASLWTERAVEYRAAAGLEVEECAIAVVIQHMVRPDVSFVLFTTDPVTGNSDQVVITASWGLGEAVVSGLVTPDHIVVDSDGNIVRYSVGAKEYMMLEDPPPGEGVRQIMVPKAMRGKRALTDEQAAMIASVGRTIAGKLGYDADIEGGIVDGDVVLFQARPITTLANFEATPGGTPLRVAVQSDGTGGQRAM
jgi:rifampicin phosphotransferase